MKYILIVAVVAVVGVGLFSTVGKEVTYEKGAEATVEIIDNTPDWAKDADAIAAAEAVIKKKELEAELESLLAEEKAENERHDLESDRITAEIEKREKELGIY